MGYTVDSQYLLIIQGNKCKFPQVCRLKENTVGIFHCFACLLTVCMMGLWILKRPCLQCTVLILCELLNLESGLVSSFIKWPRLESV